MFERKRAAARLVYGVVLALVAVATMAATATAAVDEDELTDVGKTVTGLQKKLDELHERGGRAKKATSPQRRSAATRSRSSPSRPGATTPATCRRPAGTSRHWRRGR